MKFQKSNLVPIHFLFLFPFLLLAFPLCVISGRIRTSILDINRTLAEFWRQNLSNLGKTNTVSATQQCLQILLPKLVFLNARTPETVEFDELGNDGSDFGTRFMRNAHESAEFTGSFACLGFADTHNFGDGFGYRRHAPSPC
uniref:Uncharacterized protein n=1 Tax=Medicago truncatula TaxID=3880 RepID=I3SPT4_MEDTR|nr:unknown [Medicago truncatula]